MNLWGWLIMLASVLGTTAWVVWCFWKVLRTPEETDKLHGVPFQTPDEER
jgi:hypothetical protein